MNHATTASATRKEITKPMASTIHSWVFAGMAPNAVAAAGALGCSVLTSVYSVAASIVGKLRKKENSRAAGRDIPTNCPPAMVDMEREVPGKTAEAIWHMP